MISGFYVRSAVIVLTLTQGLAKQSKDGVSTFFGGIGIPPQENGFTRNDLKPDIDVRAKANSSTEEGTSNYTLNLSPGTTLRPNKDNVEIYTRILGRIPNVTLSNAAKPKNESYIPKIPEKDDQKGSSTLTELRSLSKRKKKPDVKKLSYKHDLKKDENQKSSKLRNEKRDMNKSVDKHVNKNNAKKSRSILGKKSGKVIHSNIFIGTNSSTQSNLQQLKKNITDTKIKLQNTKFTKNTNGNKNKNLRKKKKAKSNLSFRRLSDSRLSKTKINKNKENPSFLVYKNEIDKIMKALYDRGYRFNEQNSVFTPNKEMTVTSSSLRPNPRTFSRKRPFGIQENEAAFDPYFDKYHRNLKLPVFNNNYEMEEEEYSTNYPQYFQPQYFKSTDYPQEINFYHGPLEPQIDRQEEDFGFYYNYPNLVPPTSYSIHPLSTKPSSYVQIEQEDQGNLGAQSGSIYSEPLWF